ncbi:peptidoglycan-binding domain-containing protein [Streptomyces sp. YIM 130001]|uniref:peptidoglycan-binding domain-containing protein n=1 Tax=Streptomyces sp. YIM 130001 TaxID=2259644 RepID=UPI0013C50922|nr:peptidoglycan-binding domain-containing protein [Streptomyces sp. YIM 130001]
MDPLRLRIRPYVSLPLPDDAEAGRPAAAPGHAPDAGPVSPGYGLTDTAELPAAAPGAWYPESTAEPEPYVSPVPGAGSRSGGGSYGSGAARHFDTFDDASAFPDDTAAGGTARTHRRGRGASRGSGRRRAVLAIAGAAGAVVAVAALSSGLFSSGTEDESALPDRTRGPATVAPAPSPSTSSASPSPSASTTSSAPPSPSASATGSASAEASPTRPSERASRSSTPSERPSRTERPAPPPPTPDDDPVEAEDTGTLRQGDSGSEVRELQGRLRQIGLYDGRIDGDYDWRVADAVGRFQQYTGVTDDPWGVYGPATRRALEG